MIASRIDIAEGTIDGNGGEIAPPVFIAGMHRSGTSIITKLLYECGLFLGDTQHLLAPLAENPDGFWENVKFVALNESILKEMGGGWDCPPAAWNPARKFSPALEQEGRALIQELGGKEFWGWKDPRNSLTLPFWSELLPRMKVVIVVRNPLEVAYSLLQRNGISYKTGLALWTTYNERLLNAINPCDRVVTHYHKYFTEPELELGRVIDFVGLPVAEETIAQVCHSLRGDRRHSWFTTGDLAKMEGAGEAMLLYARMCAEAGFTENEDGTAAVLPSKEQHSVEISVLQDEINRLRALQMLDKQRIAELREMLLDVHDQLLQRDNQLVKNTGVKNGAGFEGSTFSGNGVQANKMLMELVEFMNEVDAGLKKLYRSRRWKWGNPISNFNRLVTQSPNIRGYWRLDETIARYKQWLNKHPAFKR